MLLVLQASTGWEAPTMAIALVVIALAFVAIAVTVAAVGIAALRQMRRMEDQLGEVKGELRDTMHEVRRFAHHAGNAARLVHRETRRFARTSRSLQADVRAGADAVRRRMDDVGALFDVVYEEVADAALGATDFVRKLRRGGGVVRRLRRFLAPGR